MVTKLVENEQGIEVAIHLEKGGVYPLIRTFVDEETVADLLAYAAVDMDFLGCRRASCEDCNPARAAWWRACNSLSIKTRRGMQALMRDAGIPLPEGPFEEDEIGVVSAP